MILGLLTVLFVISISWQGMRRISIPIQLLSEQTKRLSSGEPLEAFHETGIKEIDELERAFAEMAHQITAYRAGLRRYIEALTQTQENERKRIARELHDETVQNLLAISRQLELYQDSESEPTKLNRLKKLQAVMGETLKGIRQISRDLRPLMLEDLGLIPALQHLVSAIRQGEGALPHAQLEVQGECASLTAEQELAIYRITQEALTNVRKHASAMGVLVKVAFEDEQTLLEIADNGIGFEMPESLAELTQRGSFGLMGIQERTWAMGGNLSIQSSPSQGTKIDISIPVSKLQEGENN
jgi:signal transduction histidine kinase